MRLSLSCGDGHTKPVGRAGDPKPGIAFDGDVVRMLSME